MASTADSATVAAPEVEVPVPEVLPVDESKTSVRYRRAEIHTQVLGNLMGTRASIVGHNLNHLIKNFTIWTVAIMFASLVVGLFSMNVALPLPMEEAGWPFWLINILAFCGGVHLLSSAVE